jgi:predicted transcriptional regulator
MAALPNHRPKQLTLGSLESEILNIIWDLETATVKEIHDRILSNPNRELAYTSVTTVLNRLVKKGWLTCDKQERSFLWRSLVSRQQAKALHSYEQLNQFLAVSNPDVVAAFADSLDQTSVEQLEAIAEKLRAVRKARESDECIP